MKPKQDKLTITSKDQKQMIACIQRLEAKVFKNWRKSKNEKNNR